MTMQVRTGKFEELRAKWEAQQQQPNLTANNASPTAPGRTPVRQRKFYSSSTEARESKIRRFSSFAAFTSPINPFSRRDRSGMPFPKSPSSKTLVARDDRQDPPPPLKRGHASRLPSFKSVSSAMPPPPRPASKHGSQRTEPPSFGGLPRSQTTSNIPLMVSSASASSKVSPGKRPPSGVPSRKATGLRQPSQSTSNLIRSRPPTPHRSADNPLPVTAHSTNDLFTRSFSNSSNNLRSKLPTPVVAKGPRQAGAATKMFAGMVKTSKANNQRSYTQPNLPSAASFSAQLSTPRKTAFREEFATKTPRYMSENSKPSLVSPSKPTPAIDDLFAPDDGSDIPDEPHNEELRRWGVVGKDAWSSPRVVKTPPTIKPRRMSGVRASQLPRLHSTSSIPQQGLGLTPLSPPVPRTPRHSTAHSLSLPPPGSGVSRPNILRDSQLSPCPEDAHSGPHPKIAMRFPPGTAADEAFTRTWSPPPSPTPTSTTTTSSSPSLLSSPTPALMNPHTVWSAEPASYWAGRLTALCDRRRTADFDVEGRAFRATCRVSDTFAAFADDRGEDRRAERVFAELRACCLTDAAAASLREFQRRWAERVGSVVCMPPPPVPTTAVAPGVIVLGKGGGSGGGGKQVHGAAGCEDGLRGGGDGKGRKTGMGFMERLKGIARKTGS